MKIRPLAVELFHADGRTDMTKLRVAFRDFTTRLQTILRPRKEITLFGPRIYSYISLSLHCTFLYILQFSSPSVFRNMIKEPSETVQWRKHFGLGDIIEGVKMKYKYGQRYIRL
jgi:hypothetical protein